MLEMIQYVNGETRVVDTERMIASGFLHSEELAFPLSDYELDCELSASDLAAEYKILREELVVGQRVEAGEPGTDDHDTGKILSITGDMAEVGWKSGVKTSIPLADLTAL